MNSLECQLATARMNSRRPQREAKMAVRRLLRKVPQVANLDELLREAGATLTPETMQVVLGLLFAAYRAGLDDGERRRKSGEEP